MTFGLVCVVLSIVSKVMCDCSVYPDENTCDNKLTYRCLWNNTGTTNSEKCSQIFCSNYTDSTSCAANNGVLGCKWDDNPIFSQKCHDPRCGDYNSSDAACLANSGQLDCVYNDSKCVAAECKYYAADEGTCKNNGKVYCNWDENGQYDFDKCFEQECEDYITDESTCNTNNGHLSCVFTAGTPNTCEGLHSCSQLTSKGQSVCVASELDCRWNGSACGSQSCIYIEDRAACNARSGCGWSYLLDFCGYFGCSDFAGSQTICESEHGDCHYDGSCKEGSRGTAMNVPSLVTFVMLLLAFVVGSTF